MWVSDVIRFLPGNTARKRRKHESNRIESDAMWILDSVKAPGSFAKFGVALGSPSYGRSHLHARMHYGSTHRHANKTIFTLRIYSEHPPARETSSRATALRILTVHAHLPLHVGRTETTYTQNQRTSASPRSETPVLDQRPRCVPPWP
jgi:hypothetical protein